jgi:hypothetical protein
MLLESTKKLNKSSNCYYASARDMHNVHMSKLFLQSLSFDTEDRGIICLRNVGNITHKHKAQSKNGVSINN